MKPFKLASRGDRNEDILVAIPASLTPGKFPETL